MLRDSVDQNKRMLSGRAEWRRRVSRLHANRLGDDHSAGRNCDFVGEKKRFPVASREQLVSSWGCGCVAVVFQNNCGEHVGCCCLLGRARFVQKQVVPLLPLLPSEVEGWGVAP